MATGRERNGKIAVLCGTVVVVAVIAVAMFIGMSKSGATDKMTSAQMACGENHVLVVDAAGDVYAWGHNLKGELGDVTCDNKSAPVRIEVPGTAVQVEAGNDVAHALSYQFSVGAMMTADHTIGYHAGKQGFDGSKDCDCKGR